MIELLSTSPEHTRGLAAAIAGLARPGDLIVLAGQMGAGKTAFAQGFAKQLGIHEPVTSPTYTLVHTYQAGSTTLHHVDLYRLDHTAEVDDLALPELLDDRSIMLVEWGDVVDLGPHLHVELRVDKDDVDVREITLTSDDRRWAPRWERLEAAVHRWIAPGDSR
ncbi:MAG: putative ATP-binding protein [Ilumatobacteraceae bacterium]|nr:putative ATP-binding protein [Ilumatobacteraceae bacterium]